MDRFGFTWAWWSAFGYKRKIQSDIETADSVYDPYPHELAADAGHLLTVPPPSFTLSLFLPPSPRSLLLQMEIVDQNKAYDMVGLKIKEDLLTGNAVVLFAYGLSGSGKTFTVFGPDAIDIPEAWFKHAEPHPLVSGC